MSEQARPTAITVEHIGEGVPYADGHETEVLSILAAADDRRAVSDELAGHIHDWPTTYHLSRLRTNLLAPLRLRPDMRVLDVGAGTGTIARGVAEHGASVIALEGSNDRAAAAALRCAGAGDVRVIVGSVAELDDESTVDLALCVGVLEYAGARHGGGGGPTPFLQRLADSLAPGGVAAVAIENQFGLKYLLGHDEDHLARPMIGIEDYPGAESVRTWSRAQLEGLLSSVGLTAHRWLFPFPDYKLPTTILGESAYDDAELVDHLLRWPTSDHQHSRTFPVDHRRAHRAFVEAGLGPEVANSFLVLAAHSPADIDGLVDPDAVAWLAGGDRRRRWRRVRCLSRGVDELRLSVIEPSVGIDASWLERHEPVETGWTTGRTVEGLVLDAWADDDLDAAEAALRRWDGYLGDREQPAEAPPSTRPYAPVVTALPDDHLDVGLANFVDDDGQLHYIDAEWSGRGGVDAPLGRYRALWYFCRDVTEGAAYRPAELASLSTDQLAAALAKLIGIDAAAAHERFLDDEPQFQAEVSGGDPLGHRAALVHQGASVGPQRSRRVVGPVGDELDALAAERDRLAAHVTAAEAELVAWRARWARLERVVPVRLIRRVLRRGS